METVALTVIIDERTLRTLEDYASWVVRTVEAGEVPALALADIEGDLEGLAASIILSWLQHWQATQPRPAPAVDEPQKVVTA